MHHARRITCCVVSAVLGMLSGACDESGLSAPRDPGTVRVRVRDEQAAPVPGAGVRVAMPNNSGGVFEFGVSTRADGMATVSGVPAGSRRVTVTPPTGFAPGTEPLVRTVDVVKGQTVEVTFVLRRGAGAMQVAHPLGTGAERSVAADGRTVEAVLPAARLTAARG